MAENNNFSDEKGCTYTGECVSRDRGLCTSTVPCASQKLPEGCGEKIVCCEGFEPNKRAKSLKTKGVASGGILTGALK